MSDNLECSKFEYEEFMRYADSCVHKKAKSIKDLTDEFNERFGSSLTTCAMSHRLRRYRSHAKSGRVSDTCAPVRRNKKKNKNKQLQQVPQTTDPQAEEYTTTYGDHSIEAKRIVEYSAKLFGDEDKLLEYLGYNPKKWEFVYNKKSIWNQQTKDIDPRTGSKVIDLYSIQFKVRPKAGLDADEYLAELRKAIEEGIEPMSLSTGESRKPKSGLDDTKLMEIAPIELHLGKLAHNGETGQDYDLHIATNKFYGIFNRIAEMQAISQCGKALIVIGSDFFNSESDNMTTGKTPQQNDTRYKKLMVEGFKMYVSAILRMKELFNTVDVILCAGNHARAMEFFLYHSLQQYFKDDTIVTFRDDYKDTQAYVFGKCAIFYNHGDANIQRTIQSIPSEFYDIWGKTLYRELHLGHLHKEWTTDDTCGMITRRIGSPSATDAWHYTNRFIGATQKHQVFVWDAEQGLQANLFINTAFIN